MILEELWLQVLLAFGVAIGSLITVLIIRVYSQGPDFVGDVRLEGKVIIVTGCNTGIGKETVLDLARRGGTVYMACRNRKKCEIARQEIITKSGNDNIHNVKCDLGSFQSIRTFAAQFREKEMRLDILINNAGLWSIDKLVTQEGVEGHFGVNHLGHFLLTTLLLDMLKASAPSRIVVLSGMVHSLYPFNRDINYEKTAFISLMAYAQSKLANILFVHGLYKRLKGTGVTVNAVHPGVVQTELGRQIPMFIRAVISPVNILFLKSARKGAQTTLYVAMDPMLEKVSGRFFCDCEERTIGINACESLANDDDEWLWKKSVELIDQREYTTDNIDTLNWNVA